MVIIDLYRSRFTDNSTQGFFNIVAGGPLIYTLEPAAKSGMLMPEGAYRCVKSMSNDMRYVSPELQSVPGHSGERMHIGNRPTDTKGCILVGLTTSEDWVGLSEDAFEELMDTTPDDFFIRIQTLKIQ